MQRALVAWLRSQYASALAEMDRIAANSVNVQRRLEHYLGLTDVQVIHPPVATDLFNWQEPQPYYLSCARLEAYKRVDLLIEAFRLMPGQNLVIASGGSDEARLRRLARGLDNIQFTGWLSAERMRERVAQCIATVYVARDEDFGMSPVESMAAGKPVIGAASGGLLETVVPDETGLLLDETGLGESTQNAAELIRTAVEKLDVNLARNMRRACEQRAALFDRRNFDRRFAAFLAGE